jgi:hypothetical protein
VEHAEQHVRLIRGYTVSDHCGRPRRVVGDDAADGASGEVVDDAGDVVEVERVRRGQRRGRTIEPALVGEGDRCRFGEVGVRGPGHGPIGRRD